MQSLQRHKMPDVFFKHKGKKRIDISGWNHGIDSVFNNNEAKEVIDSVLEAYAKKSRKALSDLTHLEEPWKKAIDNNDPEVSIESIYDYFKK